MMKTYFIQTYGCQMNTSDSERVAGVLQSLGYEPVDDAKRCSLLVFNTCSIRQHAEDRLYGAMKNHKVRKRSSV